MRYCLIIVILLGGAFPISAQQPNVNTRKDFKRQMAEMEKANKANQVLFPEPFKVASYSKPRFSPALQPALSPEEKKGLKLVGEAADFSERVLKWLKETLGRQLLRFLAYVLVVAVIGLAGLLLQGVIELIKLCLNFFQNQ